MAILVEFIWYEYEVLAKCCFPKIPEEHFLKRQICLASFLPNCLNQGRKFGQLILLTMKFFKLVTNHKILLLLLAFLANFP